MAARDHFRALARHRLRLPATLTALETGSRQELRLVDLGLGGACVELTGPEPVLGRGVVVRLEVRSPNLWDPLALLARVAWSRPPARDDLARMGLEFEPASGPALRALVELLSASGYE